MALAIKLFELIIISPVPFRNKFVAVIPDMIFNRQKNLLNSFMEEAVTI